MNPLQTQDFDITTFFQATPDLVCIAGKDGYFQKINQAVVTKLEYSEEELLQRPINSFIHPEDQALTGEKREKLLGGEALMNFQNRYCTKSGKVVWLQWTSVYLADQEVVFAIAKDVTEKKKMEEEMDVRYREFESLTRYFKQTMERDRKYVALELHEELAQLASMVKLNMGWIEGHLSELSENIKSRLQQVSVLSEHMVKAIRKIAFTIGPGMLEDLGLHEALQVLAQEFTVLHSIPCVVECNLDTRRLTQEEALDFFRICQEILGAGELFSTVDYVNICLENERQNACLHIRFECADGELLADIQQRYLTRIRQRVASMNGQCFLTTPDRTIVQLRVTIPWSTQNI